MTTPKQPQDRLPKKTAQQREAERDGGTVPITWRDLQFAIPANLEDVDGEFLRYAADQDAYRMVETILDEKQFAQFKAAKPKVSDYRLVGDQIAEVYGFEGTGN